VNRSQRDVALLLNPSAGKGHALRWHGELTRRLTDSGCRVRSLVGRNAAESSALAAAAIAAGVEELVLVGGDGLVHQVLPHTVGTSVALGVIPVGTGNDLARALSIPARDPLAAVDVVIGRHSRLVDVGRAGDTYFATVLATGFDRRLTDNWTVSAGYNYASPLIPGRNLFPIAALLAQHHISVGLRYEREHWTLSGGYTLGVTQGLTSGPSAFPGNVPGVARNDFANSFLSQTQHGIFAGIGYRY